MASMAQEYRRRPEVVRAMQWQGNNLDEIHAFKEDAIYIEAAGQLQLPTADGIRTAWVGDWVVQAAHGEFYVAKDEVFQDRYTLFEE